MKYKLSLLFVLFSILQISAQTYTLTFSAHGASNTIDSVQFLNSYYYSNQCTSFTIYGSDTLHLTFHTGVNSNDNNTEKLNVFPNPFDTQTKMCFNNSFNTRGFIQIYNVSGKQIYQKLEDFPKGKIVLIIEGLRKGIYFIKISIHDTVFTSKLISLNNTGNENIEVKTENSFIEFDSETPLKNLKNNVYVDIDNKILIYFF